MKRVIFTSLLALLSAFLLHAADTIILKDGTTLEGQISDEDADTYTIKIKPAGGGLAVPRIVRKDDIKEVKKEGPDVAVFKSLQTLVPAPDRLTAAQYKERIGRGQAFLVRYPDSEFVPEVKKIMKTLEDEHVLAQQGGLKLNGKWISPSVRMQDAYEIDARIEIADMKEDLDAGRYSLALRHFETIQADFAASEQFEKARTYALEALKAYRPTVAGMLANVDSRKQKRQDELQRLPVNQRNSEEAAIARQDAAYMKRVKSEQAAKTKWFTLHPYHKGPLQAVQRNIDATVKNLENIPNKDDAKFAGPIYREAWEAARGSNYEGGKELLSELKSLNVPERYLVDLEKQLTPPENEVVETPRDEEPEENEPVVEDTPKEKRSGTVERSDAKKEVAVTPTSVEEEKKGFPIQIILVIVLVLVIVGALVAAFSGKKH